MKTPKIIDNKERKLLALLELEKKELEEQLTRYPIPAPAVLKREEMDNYMRKREILESQRSLLRRIINTMNGLIVGD